MSARTLRRVAGRAADLRPDRRTLLWGALLVNTEALLVLGYVAAVGVTVRRPLFYVYPFVWLNVSLWAVVRTVRPPAGRGERWVAVAVAAGYFAVLAYAGGLVGPGGRNVGLRVALTSLPPGWTPAVLYEGALVKVSVFPFKLVGYAVLSYLAYVTVLDAASGLVGGLVGLFSCVGCTLPVVAGVVGGLVGGSTALAATAYGQSYALSTVAFVLAVALLYWRPALGSPPGGDSTGK